VAESKGEGAGEGARQGLRAGRRWQGMADSDVAAGLRLGLDAGRFACIVGDADPEIGVWGRASAAQGPMHAEAQPRRFRAIRVI
jgi:hypothetical protein